MASLAEILVKKDPTPRAIPKKQTGLSLVSDTPIGLEYELENLNANYMPKRTFNYWDSHRDGSLRGVANEFVFSNPIGGDRAIAALEELYSCFKNGDLTINGNYRTSLHVHVNMLDLNPDQTALVMLASALADPTLFAATNPTRKSCGFCRPSEHILIPRAGALLRNNLGVLGDGGPLRDYRYYSVNAQALAKFGTLEYRHFATPATIEDSIKLINMCLAIREAGINAHKDLTNAQLTDGSIIYNRLVPELEKALKMKLAPHMPETDFVDLFDLAAVVNTRTEQAHELDVDGPVPFTPPQPRTFRIEPVRYAETQRGNNPAPRNTNLAELEAAVLRNARAREELERTTLERNTARGTAPGQLTGTAQAWFEEFVERTTPRPLPPGAV